jgi:hypothetical protein
MNAGITIIPFDDVRDGGPLRHAIAHGDRARALRDECLGFFPRAAAPLLPALDAAARHWLTRSRSPYVNEVAQIAAALGFPGVWFLNGSYQWGCTTIARDEDGVPWLARTLDWVFPGLGRHVEILRMAGPAGDFLNVTWSAYVGALTAMAPGRFAACINQAPMWRRTDRPMLRFYDLMANALNTWARIRHMPPDHLLRQTLETCANYSEARAMLETVPVARPVIYTLVGCAPDERCVIERTEEGFQTREHDTSAANDWLPQRPRWEGRIPAAGYLTRTSASGADNSRVRRDALVAWPHALSRGGLDWVAPPILNPYTRLAVVMCPACAVLRAAGYEQFDADLPQLATVVWDSASRPAA